MQIIAKKIKDIEKEIEECDVEDFDNKRFNKKYKEKLKLQKKMIELELKFYE